MILLNPKQSQLEHLDEQSRELLLKTIAFFENKGKAKIKEDDHKEYGMMILSSSRRSIRFLHSS